MKTVRFKRFNKAFTLLIITFLFASYLAILVPSVQADATISRVQSVNGTIFGVNSTTATLPFTPVYQHLLIAGIGNQISVSVKNITQSGVTWAKAVNSTGSTTGNAEIWYGNVTTGSASKVANVTFNANTTGTFTIIEYRGLAIGTPVDQTAYLTGGGTTGTNIGTGTTSSTTTNNQLWIGCTVTTWGSASQTSPTNSFSLIGGSSYGGSVSTAILEKIVSTTGTASCNTTASESNYWDGCIATFKASSAADIASLIVSKSGSDYQAALANGTVYYGGASDAAGIDGAYFHTVMQAALGTVDNVTIAAGDYVSNATVFVPSNKLISGAGNTTFIQQIANISKGDGQAGCAIFSLTAQSHNITIENMWLDGNRWNQSPTYNTYEDLYRFGVVGYYGAGVGTDSNYNITTRNLVASNFTNCGIDMPFAHDWLVDNVRTMYNPDGGIWVDVNTYNYTVQNCVSVGDNIGIAMIFFDTQGNHTGVVRGNQIFNSTAKAVNGNGNGINVFCGGAVQPYGIHIYNNTVMYSQAGNIWLSGATNCTVENNTSTYSLGGSDGVMLSDASNRIVIRNNTLTHNGWYGVQEAAAFAEDYNEIYGNDLQSNGLGDLSLVGAHTVAYDNIPDNPYPEPIPTPSPAPSVASAQAQYNVFLGYVLTAFGLAGLIPLILVIVFFSKNFRNGGQEGGSGGGMMGGGAAPIMLILVVFTIMFLIGLMFVSTFSTIPVA